MKRNDFRVGANRWGVGVVVPCFNEAARLSSEEFSVGLSQSPDWKWLFVDDGSTDGTDTVLARLVEGHSNASFVRLPRNCGKGEAIRYGVSHLLELGATDWIGYLDADLATPLSEFFRLVELAQAGPHRIAVLGSRIPRLGARIERHPQRHYTGRLAALLASKILSLPVYDTQCGAKVFRGEVVSGAFAEPFMSRWLFDVELLARCRNLVGRERFEKLTLEEPLLEWLDKPGSKIRLWDIFVLPWQVWKIQCRYSRSDSVRRPHLR